MVINFDIVCITGTVRGQAKKNNVSIPRKTGKSTIVTHGTIRVKRLLKTELSRLNSATTNDTDGKQT